MSAINSVTLEILWKRLIAAVEEASATIIRTSFSTSIRESMDFACVLTNSDGHLLAQGSQAIPGFIGSLPRTVRILKELPVFAEAHPGDVWIMNDPWMGTGHLPDVTVVRPIFLDGRVVAYAASTAHQVDIGGRVSSVEMRDIYEEGLQIPPLKLVDRGKVDETIIAFLRQNNRSPDELIGDLWSQVSALDVIEQRTLALMKEYRLEDLNSLSEELFNRTEAAMRAAIKEVPKGTYRFAVQPEGLPAPVTLQIAITFDGERCHIDFAGSSDQVEGISLNCSYSYTYGYTAFAIKCLLAPSIPNNEGILRCIEIDAPLGSIVNHKPPVAGLMRHIIGHHLAVLTMTAMAQALPERVIAQTGGAPIWYIHQTGVNKEGRPYANILFFNGGVGANSTQDGANVLSWPTNISGVPVELSELLAPIRIEKKSLWADSGGAGKYRGGLGLDVQLRITDTTPINLTILGEHTKMGALGVANGKPGRCGEAMVNGKKVEVNKNFVLKPGDRVNLRTPGGGGYGDASQRPGELIEEDLREGYITARP